MSTVPTLAGITSKMIPTGHSPHVEKPAEFMAAFLPFVAAIKEFTSL